MDTLTTSITLIPLVQSAMSSGIPVRREAAAAAAYAAKLPQLTTIRLRGFVGESLGDWLASPFGSCAALSRVTQLQLEADRCPEADARWLAGLVPALEAACLDSQPLAGLVAALAQRCPRLQLLRLAFGESIVTAPPDRSHPHLSALLQGLRQLQVCLSPLGNSPCPLGRLIVMPETMPLSGLAGLAGLEVLQWDLPWRWAALSNLLAGLTELTLTQQGEPEAPADRVSPLRPGSLDRLTALHLPGTELDARTWTHVLAHLPSLRVARTNAHPTRCIPRRCRH